MPNPRLTLPRPLLIVLVAGGLITILVLAWQGDPQARAAATVGTGLIGTKALVVVLLRLYTGIPLKPRAMMIATCISYGCTVVVFAALYSFLDANGGIQRPNGGPSMSIVDALYLSVATISGLGYTDRYPLSDPAKLMAMLEVLMGLGYAVFVFSLLAGILQDRDR